MKHYGKKYKWEDCLGFYTCPYCHGQRQFFDEDFGDTTECPTCRGHGDVVFLTDSIYLDADEDERTLKNEEFKTEVKNFFNLQ